MQSVHIASYLLLLIIWYYFLSIVSFDKKYMLKKDRFNLRQGNMLDDKQQLSNTYYQISLYWEQWPEIRIIDITID